MPLTAGTNAPSVLVGAKVIQEYSNPSNYRYDYIGKNSEVFTFGDLVCESNGLLKVGTSKIVGIAQKTVTMASTNQTAAQVRPPFTPVSENTIVLMFGNQDFVSNVSAGYYYGVNGATAKQFINNNSGSTTVLASQTGAGRTVLILKVDPLGLGSANANTDGVNNGLRYALVKIVNRQDSNVNITG